jgi:hypothetical protein
MRGPQFGFCCGVFSVVLSGNEVILPGSKDAPLRKSLLPYMDMNQAAGPYTLRATCADSIICDIPVKVIWAGHATQPEPFLGFQAEDTPLVMSALQAYVGKRVELAFTRRTH